MFEKSFQFIKYYAEFNSYTPYTHLHTLIAKGWFWK